jgi:tetratricopeptide (TPR) repeat protein
MTPRSSLATVTCLLTLGIGVAWAKPPDITQVEMQVLPTYCSFTQDATGGMRSPGFQRWRKIYGTPFESFHHYCWGLIYLMRADYSGTPQHVRDYYLANAFSEIEYSVAHTPTTHVLLPEMFTKQGEINRRLKKPLEGVKLLDRAIEINAKYWRAYYQPANCYIALNDKAKARATLEQGLTQVPDSKVLQSLLTDLGGDPAAVIRKTASGAAPAETSAPATNAPAPRS